MNKFIPYIYISLFVVLTAITMVFIHNISVNIPVELMLMLTSAYAIIFFHALRYKTCIQSYRKLKRCKGSYVGVLLSLALLWGGSFAISAYYSASIYLLFATAWSGFLGAQKLYRYKAFALIGLIIFSYGMLYVTDPMSLSAFMMMIILTTVTGVSMFGYFKFSHHLNDTGLDAVNVLMVRFWGVFVLSLGCTLYTGAWKNISWNDMMWTVLLAICAIVPVYFSQKSVEAIGSNKTSMLVTATPFVTFLLELVFTNHPVTTTGYLSVLLMMISVSFYIKPTSLILR